MVRGIFNRLYIGQIRVWFFLNTRYAQYIGLSHFGGFSTLLACGKFLMGVNIGCDMTFFVKLEYCTSGFLNYSYWILYAWKRFKPEKDPLGNPGVF